MANEAQIRAERKFEENFRKTAGKYLSEIDGLMADFSISVAGKDAFAYFTTGFVDLAFKVPLDGTYEIGVRETAKEQ